MKQFEKKPHRLVTYEIRPTSPTDPEGPSDTIAHGVDPESGGADHRVVMHHATRELAVKTLEMIEGLGILGVRVVDRAYRGGARELAYTKTPNAVLYDAHAVRREVAALRQAEDAATTGEPTARLQVEAKRDERPRRHAARFAERAMPREAQASPRAQRSQPEVYFILRREPSSTRLPPAQKPPKSA